MAFQSPVLDRPVADRPEAAVASAIASSRPGDRASIDLPSPGRGAAAPCCPAATAGAEARRLPYAVDQQVKLLYLEAEVESLFQHLQNRVREASLEDNRQRSIGALR